MIFSFCFFSVDNDFIGQDLILTYAANDLPSQRECANITILEDEMVESDEMFLVQIDSSDSSVMLDRSTAPVTIVDNDGTFLCPANIIENGSILHILILYFIVVIIAPPVSSNSTIDFGEGENIMFQLELMSPIERNIPFMVQTGSSVVSNLVAFGK